MTEQNLTNSQATPSKMGAAASPAQLQPYHPPTFVRYGSVANIVQNMEGMGADGGTFGSDTAS